MSTVLLSRSNQKSQNEAAAPDPQTDMPRIGKPRSEPVALSTEAPVARRTPESPVEAPAGEPPPAEDVGRASGGGKSKRALLAGLAAVTLLASGLYGYDYVTVGRFIVS